MKQFIFGVVLGGCVAGVASYFITKDRVEKRVRRECEDIICTMRAHYAEQFEIKKAEILNDKEDPEEIVKRYHEVNDIYNRTSKDVVGDKVIRSEVIDRAEMERPSEDDAPDEYYEDAIPVSAVVVDDPVEAAGILEGIAADKYDKENRRRAPERITREEFDNRPPGYEQKEYTYYVEDMTYTDESDMVINDEIDLFGPAIEGWDLNHEDTDPIFIRNYRLQCDYMIEKMFCESPKWVPTD